MRANVGVTCGLVDCLVVVAGGIVAAALNGVSPLSLFTEHAPAFVLVVVPVAVLAAWRGGVHAIRLSQGQRGWVRPAVEGFLLGFLFAPTGEAIMMLHEAWAAGPNYPEFSAPAAEWAEYLKHMLIVSTVLGASGSLGALLISGVNRGVLKFVAPL